MSALLPRFGPLSPESLSRFSFFGRFSVGGRDRHGLIRIFFQRWLQRRALEEMDDERLADIGVSRSEARREARKPFWRA